MPTMLASHAMLKWPIILPLGGAIKTLERRLSYVAIVKPTCLSELICKIIHSALLARGTLTLAAEITITYIFREVSSLRRPVAMS